MKNSLYGCLPNLLTILEKNAEILELMVLYGAFERLFQELAGRSFAKISAYIGGRRAKHFLGMDNQINS
jgi:hypothetical protein